MSLVLGGRFNTMKGGGNVLIAAGLKTSSHLSHSFPLSNYWSNRKKSFIIGKWKGMTGRGFLTRVSYSRYNIILFYFLVITVAATRNHSFPVISCKPVPWEEVRCVARLIIIRISLGTTVLHILTGSLFSWVYKITGPLAANIFCHFTAAMKGAKEFFSMSVL